MGEATTVVLLDIEDDPLALTKQAEHAARQGTGSQVHLRPVLIEYDHPRPGVRVVEFDHALHGPAV